MRYPCHRKAWPLHPLVRVWLRHLVTLALAVLVVGMWVAVGWVIVYLASGPTL